VLIPVKVLRVGNGFIIGSHRHDALSNKHLFPFVFGSSSPTEDGGDGLGGILVGGAYILLPSFALVVIYFIIVTSWPLCILYVKSPIQTLALTHGVLGTFVDRAWAV
jgi:hypothetical protein